MSKQRSTLPGVSNDLMTCALRVLCTCFALHIGVAAAQDTSCLSVNSTKVDPDRFGFSMTLANRCGKAVTAYGVAATAGFNDGSTAEYESMRQDYLPSLALDKDCIQTNAVRATPFWNIPRSQADIDNAIQLVEVRPRIRFIVFLDRTAVGEEQGIEQLFASRQRELRELRHAKAVGFRSKTELKAMTKEAAAERLESYLNALITAASTHSVRAR